MSFRSAFILAGAVALIGFQAAHAEESAMKQCADKWNAAKTAGTTGGLTYLQFSSKCRADLKAGGAAAPAAAPAATAAPAPAAPATTTTAAPAKPAAPAAAPAAPAAATGPATFPSAVNPAYKDQTPSKAIMHSCLDQYKANKATNANGGLKWIQKGGGYYSECNKKLKG